jgi:hypothetical protein
MRSRGSAESFSLRNSALLMFSAVKNLTTDKRRASFTEIASVSKIADKKVDNNVIVLLAVRKKYGRSPTRP